MNVTRRLAVALFLAGMNAGACGQEDTAPKRLEGDLCTKASECSTNLVCHSGSCRRLCYTDRDCNIAFQYCSLGVCLLGRSVLCGDGIVDGGEACDDGIDNGKGQGLCNAACTRVERCGDGHEDGTEQCDDGNTDNTDACLDTCQSASCGDGYLFVAGGEACDLGAALNTGAYGGCTSSCQLASFCGDGLVDAEHEACDDGDDSDGDGCGKTCVEEEDWECAGEPSVCLPTVDQTFEVATAPYAQNELEVVHLSDGQTGVVWIDQRNGTDEIYAQKLDRLGNSRWTANGMPVFTPTLQVLNMCVTADAGGGMFITWSNNVDGELEILTQHLDQTGARTFDDAGVQIREGSATVACLGLPDGGLLLALSANDELRLQKLSSTGLPLLEDEGRPVAVSADFNRIYPRWAANDDRSVIFLSWLESSSDPAQQRVYAAPITAHGDVLLQGGVRVSDPASTETSEYKHTTAIGADSVFVLWMDRRGSQSSFASAYAQRIDLAGARLWATDARLDSQGYVSSNGQGLHAVPDGDGGVIVSWVDGRFDTGSTAQGRVIAQRLSSTGALQWPADGVAATSVSRTQRYHTMIEDLEGGAILAWADTDGATFAQHLDGAGSCLWGTNGILRPVANNVSSIHLDVDGGGATMFLWTSYSGQTDEDIFGYKKWSKPW